MKRAALAVLLVASVLAPIAVASSPPQPLCSVCDAEFERAAEDRGVAVTVVESTVEVRVTKDGTARWTVRNRLTNDSTADRLRESGSLLDGVVAEALDRGRPDHVSDVAAHVDGNTVTVTFADDSFADRDPGGVVVVDYFHTGGDRRSQGLDADRFTVIGPDGSGVVNDPATGEVGEGQVTWANTGTEREYGTDIYVPDTYVAFAQNDGIVTDAAVRLAFARRTLPAVADNLAMLVPAGLALVGGLAAFRSVVRAELGPRRPARLAAGVLGVGLLTVVHPVYAESVPLINGTIRALGAVGIVYVLVGGTALALDRTREAVPWWWLLAPALGVLAAGIALPENFGYVGRSVVPGQALLAVPVAATFPLGYAVASGDARAARAALIATLVSVVAVALRHVTFAQKPFLGGLIAIISVALTVFGLVFAVPLVVLGASLAHTAESA